MPSARFSSRPWLICCFSPRVMPSCFRRSPTVPPAIMTSLVFPSAVSLTVCFLKITISCSSEISVSREGVTSSPSSSAISASPSIFSTVLGTDVSISVTVPPSLILTVAFPQAHSPSRNSAATPSIAIFFIFFISLILLVFLSVRLPMAASLLPLTFPF